jgi:hypothetical protein
MTGWNLPPGVTDKMIDDLFAGPCDDCLDDRHEDCTDRDCRCEECDAIAQDAADEARYEEWKESRYEVEQDEPDFDYEPLD